MNYGWITGRVDRVRAQKHHPAQPAVDPFQPNFKVEVEGIKKFEKLKSYKIL